MTPTQNPTAEAEAFLKDLDADLEGILSGEVTDLLDDADDATKLANAKFGKMRTMLKTAQGIIQTQGTALEASVAAPVVEEPVPSSQATNATDARLQADFYYKSLESQAMQSTGIADPTHELVKLEITRLYGKSVSDLALQQDAEASAEGVIDQTLAGFAQLKDEDRAAVKESVSGFSALDRANPEVIKGEVHKYIGQNFEKFKGAPKPKGDGSDAEVTPGAAAASGLKTHGTGVSLGEGEVSDTPAAPVKAASPEELKDIKKIMGTSSPSDPQIAMYRRSKAKSGGYSQTQ